MQAGFLLLGALISIVLSQVYGVPNGVCTLWGPSTENCWTLSFENGILYICGTFLCKVRVTARSKTGKLSMFTRYCAPSLAICLCGRLYRRWGGTHSQHISLARFINVSISSRYRTLWRCSQLVRQDARWRRMAGGCIDAGWLSLQWNSSTATALRTSAAITITMNMAKNLLLIQWQIQIRGKDNRPHPYTCCFSHLAKVIMLHNSVCRNDWPPNRSAALLLACNIGHWGFIE